MLLNLVCYLHCYSEGNFIWRSKQLFLFIAAFIIGIFLKLCTSHFQHMPHIHCKFESRL